MSSSVHSTALSTGTLPVPTAPRLALGWPRAGPGACAGRLRRHELLSLPPRRVSRDLQGQADAPVTATRPRVAPHEPQPGAVRAAAPGRRVTGWDPPPATHAPLQAGPPLPGGAPASCCITLDPVGGCQPHRSSPAPPPLPPLPALRGPPGAGGPFCRGSCCTRGLGTRLHSAGDVWVPTWAVLT